jgi:hypothetical protein
MMVSVIAKALQLILLVREPGAARAGPLKGSDAVASDAGLYSVRTTARTQARGPLGHQLASIPKTLRMVGAPCRLNSLEIHMCSPSPRKPSEGGEI